MNFTYVAYIKKANKHQRRVYIIIWAKSYVI